MKQLPENIDDIEKFYQEAFENEFIEPSPLLWDKISTQLPGAASTATAPLVSGVKTFLGMTAKTWLVSSVISSSFGILGYLYFSDKNFQQQPKKEDSSIQVENTVSTDSLKVNKETDTQLSTIENKSIKEKPPAEISNNEESFPTQHPTEQPNDIQVQENQSSEQKSTPSNEVLSTEVDVEKSTTMEKLEPKLESTKSVEPAPQKVNSSFFEKKTQQLKDSARPLFVPKGKK